MKGNMILAVVLLIYLHLTSIVNSQKREMVKKTEMGNIISYNNVHGVAGQKAALPCDIQPEDSNDAVSMVLWFKEPDDEPVFSYDARHIHSEGPKIWSPENFWGNRATFRVASPAQLVIHSVHESDGGEYRCRVDFRNSPTKNLKVNFTITVPPSKPIIYDVKKRDMSKHLEPYPEGADLELICEVHGGKPKPKVSWYYQGRLMNSTSEEKNIVNTDPINFKPIGMEVNPRTVIVSRVKLKKLDRSQHHTKLSCKASNTLLAEPPTTTIFIQLYLKPLTVNITKKEKVVSSNKKYKIECQSTGSLPSAILTWYKGSKQLKDSIKDFLQKNNSSKSILEWVPNDEDDGKYLTCRAENRHLPDAAIEDKWKLKVHYSPVVRLKLGSSLDPDNIREGDDVNFECRVKSNPRNFTLAWYREGKMIRQGTTDSSIRLSDQSLILHGVTREMSGNYSCVAANEEGRSRSNLINLKIMFAPICKSIRAIDPSNDTSYFDNNNVDYSNKHQQQQQQQQRFNVTRYESMIKLICQVESSPKNVTFHWTFNNTKDNEYQLEKFTSLNTFSELSHYLRNDSDYGSFGCWASNVIGHSKQPCLYHLNPPVNPRPLQNCTAHNQSGTTLIRISCVESFDGGLPQKFVAVVNEQHWESSVPYWEIEIHKPTTVSLYAVNAKGFSDPIIMEGIAYKDVAKYTGETAFSLDISPILIGLGGTATGLGLIVTAVLMALWRKHSASRSPSKPKVLQHQPTISTFNAVKGEEDDGNPDLIPTTALTNNCTGRNKLLVHHSLPRRPHRMDRQVPESTIQDLDYPRATPNTYYSLQRPIHYTDTIARHTTVQESCI